MVKNEARVTVTGWLNNVADFEWGRALKLGEHYAFSGKQLEIAMRSFDAKDSM